MEMGAKDSVLLSPSRQRRLLPLAGFIACDPLLILTVT
jgi:hypothetical protein